MFGASIRGPRNLRRGRANQDAWTRSGGVFGHLIGVCDGMGSRPAADAGARAACQALRRAARLWPERHVLGGSGRIRPISSAWWRSSGVSSCAPRAPAECASTCLFALARARWPPAVRGPWRRTRYRPQCWRASGDLRRAKLGRLRRRDARAGNVGIGSTTGGSRPSSRAAAGRWFLPPTGSRTTSPPSGWTRSRTGWPTTSVASPPAARWRRLCRELRAWPVPRHLDDKTVAVLVERPGEAS